MNQTLVRSLLKIGAGYLVAKGFADESTTEIIIAGVMALIGVVWGLIHRNPPPSGPTPIPVTYSPSASVQVDSRPPTRLSPGALAVFLVAVLSALPFVGCQSPPPAVAYRSLDAIRVVVDRAENVYGRECAAGRVTAADQKTIDQRIVEFHAAFLVAARAARSDYSTPASSDLDRLADSLVKLIYTFAKEPAP